MLVFIIKQNEPQQFMKRIFVTNFEINSTWIIIKQWLYTPKALCEYSHLRDDFLCASRKQETYAFWDASLGYIVGREKAYIYRFSATHPCSAEMLSSHHKKKDTSAVTWKRELWITYMLLSLERKRCFPQVCNYTCTNTFFPRIMYTIFLFLEMKLNKFFLLKIIWSWEFWLVHILRKMFS